MSRPAFGRAEVLVSSATKRKNKNKPRVNLDPRTPTAARLKKKKRRVKLEPRSAPGHAVKKKRRVKLEPRLGPRPRG